LLTVADHSARIRGFYAVLDRDDPALADMLINGGAFALQIRMKPASAAAVLTAARRVREITRRRGVLLVVNDRVDLALAAGADAVHLGQDDLPLEIARRLAPGLLIGVSTHDEAQVQAAVAGGADYLGYGPVFATTTKRNPDPVQGIANLARAVLLAGGVPVVGIGGITPANAAEVHASGAAAACAISSVNAAPDVAVAARIVGNPWNS
jgi:thiamine-phosphate pyrophosphorylase